MSILEILWIIVKYGFIVSAISLAVAVLFLLFHPLRLNLKLRSTIKGQRAELWFIYLFRLFKIGIVATPHTQDIVLKIAFWKKRLDRQQRERPPKPSTPAPTDSQPHETEAASKVKDSTTPDSSPTESMSSTVEPPVQSEAPHPEEVEQPRPVIPQEPESTQKDEIVADIEDDKTITENQSQQQSPKKEHLQPIPPKPRQDKEVVEPQHETVTPIDYIKQDSSAHGSDADESSPQPESFRARLRKIKGNMAKKYEQSKYYLRIFMFKWRKLAPVAKKFYTRSKKCLKIDDPNLVIYYALHEPYITGMFQGTLAVLSGTAQRVGFRFVPIPMFGAPTVYARSAATAVIMPWRLLLAFCSLLFEKELWVELWQLVKLLWAKWRDK